MSLDRHNRGASLLEVIMVLIVLGTLAGVAMGRWVDRQGLQLAAARTEVSVALRHAQRLALVKNREVCVRVASNRLSLQLNPTATPGGVCSADLPGADGLPYIVEVPIGLSSVPAAFRFRSDGQPQPAPVVLTLGPAGNTLQQHVWPLTGHVE